MSFGSEQQARQEEPGRRPHQLQGGTGSRSSDRLTVEKKQEVSAISGHEEPRIVGSFKEEKIDEKPRWIAYCSSKEKWGP